MSAELQTKPFEANDAEQLLNRLIEVTRVDAVFGPPLERDGVTLITCSELAVGLGGGIGAAKPADAQQKTKGNEGVGGGAGARGRPIAVIVMTREGVRVKPIVNVNRVVLAGLATLGFAALLAARMYRANRRTLRRMLRAKTEKH